MVHLDLQEQEQLSELKYVWHTFGKYLVMFMLAIIIIYLGNVVWNLHLKSNATQASTLYATLTTSNESALAINANANLVITQKLEKDYPNTEYAAMASLIMAKTMYTQDNLKQAASLLNWTINHAKDSGLVDIAKLRLADVYIDESKFPLALSILMSHHDAVFDPLYYIKRGDLYVVEGNTIKARDAYKEALQKSGDDSDISESIKLRLAALGSN